MKSDRWKEIERIYHAALERKEAERADFLAETCRDDAELRREVESLLGYETRAEGFIEGPALDAAAQGMPQQPAQPMIGRRIGVYEITSLIDRGGMGEVWRARDSKLGREVAIKSLPEEFAKDEERLARFEREAKLLASLNHPNIAAIYGLEEDNGAGFLILELVEGDTLAEFLTAGSLPVKSALNIALQVAEGLEAADEKGIIHRDLKPANIKVTPDGKVKVLDFGLAKTIAGEIPGPDLSIQTELETREGIIQGTPAYMSPQQARGEVVDKRVDIWSFGCVLYEMLTGRRAFPGERLTDTIARILEREPDWEGLPANLHPAVQKLLHRCLEKEPKNRWQAVGDVRVELEQLLAGKDEPLSESELESQSRPTRVLFGSQAIALLLVGVFIGGFVAWSVLPEPVPNPTRRFEIDSSPAERVLGAMSVSPDGQSIVYVGSGDGIDRRLYLRRMDSFEGLTIEGTEGARSPIFSPESTWVAYVNSESGHIMKLLLPEGRPLSVYEFEEAPEAVWRRSVNTWAGTDRIVFVDEDLGLSWVSSDGGPRQIVTSINKADGEIAHRNPYALPGAREVLFTIERDGGIEEWSLAVVSLETGEIKNLDAAGSRAQYAPTGHLIYNGPEGPMAAPFDLAALELTGQPVDILEEVAIALSWGFGDDGSLVYIADEAVGRRRAGRLVWVDREGNEQQLAGPPGAYVMPRLSPDRSQIAVNSRTNQVLLFDVETGAGRQLTFADGRNIAPVWTPDGMRVAFGGSDLNLYWKLADGSGPDELLLERENEAVPMSWSPDGRYLAFYENGPPETQGIYVLSMEDRTAEPFLVTADQERSPMFSPDGRFIAYTSDESGQTEVYVEPFPRTGGKWKISLDGGVGPLWSRSGQELFYLNGGSQMIAVDYENMPTFSPGAQRPLFTKFASRILNPNFANYDIDPGGHRFVFIKQVAFSSETDADARSAKINIVLNWFEELKERVPVP